MLKWFMRRYLKSFEKKHQYDATHMHELLDTDLRAFMSFQMAAGGLGSYRKDVPPAAYAGAGLTSSMHADCGPCTQLGVDFSLEAGVPPQVIEAIISGKGLTGDAALGARFARAVLAHDIDADAAREEITKTWGPRAVYALTFAIMAGQLYPTLKYAVGHGKACTRLVVDGRTVTRSAA